MRFDHFVLVALFASNSALPCVYLPTVQISPESAYFLRIHIENQFSEIGYSNKIRRIVAYGYSAVESASITFEPHRTEKGIGVFYALTCSHDTELGWKCGNLKEKRVLIIDELSSFIEIDESIDSETGSRIVESVRNAIIVNPAGHFKYNEWGAEKISDSPLILERIRNLGNDRYRVLALNDEPCTSHEIEITKIDCGLAKCSFRVLNNVIEHHL